MVSSNLELKTLFIIESLFPKTGWEKSIADQPTQINHSHPRVHLQIKCIAEPPMLSDKCACSQLFFLQQLQQQSLKWAGKCNRFCASPAPYLHRGACCFDTSTVWIHALALQSCCMLWKLARISRTKTTCRKRSRQATLTLGSHPQVRAPPLSHSLKMSPFPIKNRNHLSFRQHIKKHLSCSARRTTFPCSSQHVGRCRPSIIVHDLTKLTSGCLPFCFYRHTISFSRMS